jgi:hypothetical protein
MESPNDFLIRLLHQSPSLSATEVEGLANWWRRERRSEEALIDFLVRQHIFVAGAAKTVALMQKHYVSFPDESHLYETDGIERIRLRNQAPSSPGVQDTMSARVEETVGPPAPTPPRRELSGAEHHAHPTEAVRIPTASTFPEIPTVQTAGRNPRSLQIGSVLGKCLLTELLGQGGSGMVFRALHQGLNIPVAVKVLQRDALERDPRVYERLKAEARLLAQLNHPAVVRVLDFEDDAAFPYLVLEYVEGFTLSDLIHQSGSIRPHRAVRIVMQVAEGLAAARKIGIVHRDVKPANVLLTRDGHAKVADLGLAVVVDGLSRYSLGVGSAHDEAAGTVAYMSPEQFSAENGLDHRADIYSLGATFYHAITGQPPFTGGTHLEIMLKHAQEMPVPPHLVVREITPSCSAVILKMMSKDPAQRYPSYDELLPALAELSARSVASTPLPGTLPTIGGESSGSQRSSLWQSWFSSFRRPASPARKESDVRHPS